jgi:hypothetical protein
MASERKHFIDRNIPGPGNEKAFFQDNDEFSLASTRKRKHSTPAVASKRHKPVCTLAIFFNFYIIRIFFDNERKKEKG